MARPWERTRASQRGQTPRSISAYYKTLPRRDVAAFPATQSLNRLEGSSRGALLGRAGSLEGPVRVEEAAPEFEVTQTAAQVIPEVRGESPKPLISTIFDFMGRGSSGLVGFQTGLMGLDRPAGLRIGDEEDRFQPDDTLLGVATRRAMEGFRGEEVWRAADFGTIAEKKARGEASRGERVLAATSGFLVDTILDPITYMSFGGSIMGRRIASQKVEGYVQRAMREGLEIADKEALVRRGVENGAINADAVASRLDGMVADRIAKYKRDSLDENLLYKTREEAKKLADALEAKRNQVTAEGLSMRFDPSDPLDVTLSKARSYSWFDETGNVYSLLDDFAKQVAPEHAAWSFLDNGAGGLRRWAIINFGREAGERYFKSLPKDIQGGIRIRLPFYRDKNGIPKAWSIPGIGAGRLSEKSKIIRNISEFSEMTRDYIRNTLGSIPMRYLSGESGDILYAALRSWGVRARQADLSDGRRVTYNDYTNRLKMAAVANMDETRLRRTMAEPHMEASALYTEGINRFGKERFHEKWAEFFYDNQILAEARPRFEQGLMDAEEMTAYRAAFLWRRVLDNYGIEAMEAHNWNAEETVFFLQNQVPRRETEEMIRKRAAESSFRKGASDPKYVKHRSAFAQSWELKPDGDAFIVKFLQPDDINNMYARYYGVDQIYKVDPREYMGIYLAELSSSLLDKKLINFAQRTGILRRLDTSNYPLNEFINPTMTAERIAEALSISPDNALSGTGWARVLRERLDNEFRDLTREDGATLPGSLVSLAEKMSDLLAGNLRDSTMRYGIAGPRRIDFDKYIKDRTAPNTWVNEADNTRIIRNQDNSWSAIDADGNAIRNPDGSPLSYYPTQIELNIDGGLSAGLRTISDRLSTIPEVKAYRDFSYVNELSRLRSTVMDQIDKFIAQFDTPTEIFKNLDQVPLHEQPEIVQATINAAYRWLKKFGADKARFDVTDSGIPKDLETSILEWKPARSTKHTQWLEESGYTSVLSPDLEGLGWLGKTVPEMKAMVRKHMEETYAPAAVAASMRRLFAAYDKPKTMGRILFEDIYLPFYAMQKAGMTLFRGPGFVIRNMSGGAWNGHLDGVGRLDWKASSKILLTYQKAQRNVRRAMGREQFNLSPDTAVAMIEEEFAKLAKQAFPSANSFMPDTDDADAVVEIYKMFINNGMTRGGKVTQLTSELLDNFNNIRGGRSTTVPVLGPKGKLANVQVQATDDGVSILAPEDRNAFARVNQWLAFDNPWIKHVMGPLTEYSENYLRLAAYIKGVREIGLEPADSGIRGYAASIWVKSTQFDYADLSDFERRIFKMVIPFYTWTRYNVPLQVRAVLHEPGKIAQALRIRDSLAYIFGDENVEATPSFLTERLGFEIPEENFDWLPEGMRPAGNVGVGMVLAEPVVDIARWFRTPTPGGTVNPFNMREIAQNLNPAVRAFTATTSYLEGDPTLKRGEQEDLPGWASWLPSATPGVNLDPSQGQKTTNRFVLEFMRSMFPQLGVVERVVPGAGNERHPGRWFTSIMSSALGLPVNTVDGWVRASEMDRRTKAVKDQMQYMYGSDSSSYRLEVIRSLLDAGAPTEFIEMLDIGSMENEQVDVGQAVATWEYMQRIGYLYMLGFDENEIAVAMNLATPTEGFNSEFVLNVYERMAMSPDSDRSRFLREFGWQSISPAEREEMGISQRQLERMSDDELIELIRNYTYQKARERRESD